MQDSAGVLGLVPVRETAPRSLTFAMKPLGRRQFDSVRMLVAMSEKVAAMCGARVYGTGSVLTLKKRLEAKGRDDEGFIA